MARFQLIQWNCTVVVLSLVTGSVPIANCVAEEPTPIDRALLVQSTLVRARDLLTANQPQQAIQLLEQHLTEADGSRAYLQLLQSAYLAHLKKLQMTHASADEIAAIRTKLALLGFKGVDAKSRATPAMDAVSSVAAETPDLLAVKGNDAPATLPDSPPVVEPDPAAAVQPSSRNPAGTESTQARDLLNEAARLFNQARMEPGKFALAARMFAAACGARVEMRPEQMAAWAYCRIRVAADRLNESGNDVRVAAEVITEVEEALTLAPDNPGLQKIGGDLLRLARARAGSQLPSTRHPENDGWESLETASFRIRHRGAAKLAKSLADSAESRRDEIFRRWSGPAGGPWEPKCEITLHPDVAAFVSATGLPAAATGRAVVHLSGGRVKERRIDLRQDDPTLVEDALPRELSHLVIADLYPTQAPPRWAVEGMAVLATSATEIDRYLRTLPRCLQQGELPRLETLMTLPAPPKDKVTGYYVASVALVEFLVRWKGEKAFTTFLRDAQRYGLESAMKRQYGLSGPQQLEALWLQSAKSATTQGQRP